MEKENRTEESEEETLGKSASELLQESDASMDVPRVGDDDAEGGSPKTAPAGDVKTPTAKKTEAKDA
jgi:hypothetical protein